jgi:TolB-like protein/Flp pilus assembly protein TadD
MTEPTRAVFLSYASQDAEAVKRISDALRAGGIEVWFDQSELRGGDVWDHKIRQQIRDCALFVPVISVNTAARHEGYFRLEWDLADQRTHMIARDRAFIVPVCIDGAPASGADVPESFVRAQWTRLPAGAAPPGFVQRVATLLSPHTHVAAAPTQLSAGAASSALLSWRSQSALLLIAAVTIIGGYFAIDKLVLTKHVAGTGQASAQTAQVIEPLQSAIPPENSIAVLPFVDMSERKDQEYFSDGLTEELIDLLSRDTDLKVPARTSSFYFKGKQTAIAQIARTLAVRYLLEGSVRKSERKLRVTAQLVRASDGYHLWSDSYDRELKDIFKVQDEIANAVVSVLKVKLSVTPTTLAEGRTSSPEAHDQFLVGRQFVARTGPENWQHAVAAFRKAIALDPSFAAAHVGLAEAQYLLELDDSRLTPAAFKQILARLDRAIDLAPNFAGGYSERGVDLLETAGDLKGAQADLARALALDPGDSANQRRYGVLQRCLGNVEEAIEYGTKATDLDPLDVYAWFHLGESLAASGRYSEARAAYSRAIQLSPDAAINDPSDAHTGLLMIQLLQGRPDEVLRSLDIVADPAARLVYQAMAEFTLGHESESRRAVASLVQKAQPPDYANVARVYAWRGDKQQALTWLERSATYQKDDLACAQADPVFRLLNDDTGLRALQRALGTRK